MKRVFTIIIAATTLLAACSKEQAGITPDNNAGYGNIQITIVDNITRADAASNKIELMDMYKGWTAPTIWEDVLALEIVSDDPAIGIDGDKPYKSYPNVTTFNHTKNLFDAGKYSLRVVSPDPGTSAMYDYLDATGKSEVKWYEAFGQETLLNVREGDDERYVYFEGTYNVEVFPSHTSEPKVTVRIANTAVCIEFTDNFKNYFPEAHLTLETAKGTTFNIDYDAKTTYEKTYYWVNPREFTIKGSVVRQSPDGKSAGNVEKLDDIVKSKSDVKPQYCYTYRFDMSSAGDGSITITYDDAVVDAGNVKNTDKDAEDEDWFDVGPSDSEDDETEDAEDTKKE